MDSAYQLFSTKLESKGINARNVNDSLPAGFFLNLDNWTELSEDALSSRLGSIIVNRTGSTINALPAPVHSLAKLSGYQPSAWRYAGAGNVLYRRTGTSQGPYTSLATGMSGNPWSSAVYRPNLSSYPYIFIADSAKMLKDNGTTGAQQWGIFQPQTPVQAQAQAPMTNQLDAFTGTSYTTSNASIATAGPGSDGNINTVTTSAIVAGLNTVTVANPSQRIQMFQLLLVGSETVLVCGLTPTGFVANFVNVHAIGTSVTSKSLEITVNANATGTVTKTGALNLSVFSGGELVQEEDYIGIYFNAGVNPNSISQIAISFDVSDGSFTQNYFTKIIAPSVLEPSIAGTSSATDAITQSVYASTIGIYGAANGSVYPLNTAASWTNILLQMTDFEGVGQADFNDPVFNWSNVKAYQISITTNSNSSVSMFAASLVQFGGAGPDSFGGVSYDWLYTYYNAVTGWESNPCMFMSNVNPPTQTTYITPRRQPVTLTVVPSTDPQVTNIRIYRRGGSLEDNFRRVDQIAAASTTYTDTASDADIQGSAFISFTNDVPVTSTLPVPVVTTFTTAVTPTGTGQVLAVTPTSMTNISVNQQVTLGSDIDPNQEIVVVQSITGTTFTAFIQNAHKVGDPIEAESVYGQPVNGCVEAFNQIWLWGDPNNPHYVYYSGKSSPEGFSSAAFIEIGTPDNAVTAVVEYAGTLFVRTLEYWQAVAPGSQAGQSPTPYPTQTAHGGPGLNGLVKTEKGIWNQALDGLRVFDGSSANYATLDVEFLFQPQENGITPIEEADPTQFALTAMAYYNNVIYAAYTGLDGNRYRLNHHQIYNRFRNDSVPATVMLVEQDTNTLLWGDANGLIHQDQIGFYDEANLAGALITGSIPLNMQSAYMDQGAPRNLKQYQNLNLDINTGNQTLTVTLLFDDGQGNIVSVANDFSTPTRQKINIPINGEFGQTGYRASVQITGNVTQQVVIYQIAIEGLVLAEARRVWDTYFQTDDILDSKIAKDAFIEYTASQPIALSIYYDQGEVPVFNITLPASRRISTRFRLPAVKFRLRRVLAISAADFQVWQSDIRIKPVLSTSGYQKRPLLTS
jgi:hypothetical protein